MLTMTNNNLKGNLTTIVKLISMPLAGAFIGLCIKWGLNLSVDQATLAEWISIIILFGWGIMDAKYPNTMKIFKNVIIDVDSAAEYDDIQTNDAVGEEIEQE